MRNATENELLPDSTATESTRFRTHRDCLRQLWSVAVRASFAIVAAGILLALWLHDATDPVVLGAWLLAMVGIAAWRIVFARRSLDTLEGASPADLARGERRYALLTGLTGLMWGLIVWLPVADPEQQRILAFSVILYCVLLVGSSTLVASRRAFSAFSVMLVLPLVARLTTLDSRLSVLLGLGTLLMCAMVLSAFRTHNKTLIGALNSRHHSDDVLQQQRVIFESAGEGIVLLQAAPRYTVECNRRFADLFGYPAGAILGMPPWQWHPDKEEWKKLVAASLPVIAQGLPYHAELRLKRANGELFWGEVTGMAVNPEALRAGTVWTVSDISEKRAAEAALRVSEARFRDLVRISSDLYWEQDEHFRFTQFDGPDDIMRNLPVRESIGIRRWEIRNIEGVSASAWKSHIATLEQHLPFRDFIYQVLNREGIRHWYSISGNPMFDADGKFVGYHGTACDITLRVESEARFRHLAYHDPLTQLPNRRLFEDRLEQAIRSARRNEHQLALLLIDLDRFKPINDRYGHDSGDQVLEAIAERLRNSVRASDTVARLGGDEFVILLSRIEAADDATAIAEKIHVNLATPIAAGEHKHCVGASIGISLHPAHGDGADILLQRADQAMYQGKQRGGQVTTVFNMALAGT